MSATQVRPCERANPVWTTRRSSKPTAVGAATEPPDASAPKFAVVMHDDEVHSYYDYVEVLVQVFGYSDRMAYQLTQVIDAAGRAVVWKGPLDEAWQNAKRVRNHRAQWRRNRSVTAPHGVESVVPPLFATVEPVDGERVMTSDGERDAPSAESAGFERQVLSRIRPQELVGRPVREIADCIADAIAAAGYRLPNEPSLQAVKRLFARVLQITSQAAEPVVQPAASYNVPESRGA